MSSSRAIPAAAKAQPRDVKVVDLDIADCIGSVSAEQNTLFANRNGAGANDLVIYFVRSAIRTSGPNAGTGVNGCGRFPAGSPGAVVARIGSRWTLAHEVGHVLDLDHISGEDGTSGDECSTPDTSRLMTGCGTGDIVGTPTLSSDKITTMTSSPFTQIR